MSLIVGCFGIFLSLTSLTFFIIQLIFITVIRSSCGYDSSFAFTLMFCIGITDMVQLTIHCICGVLLFLERDSHSFDFTLQTLKNDDAILNNYRYQPNFNPKYVIGALMTSSWISMVFLTLFLTVHRFVWTVFPFKASSLLPPTVLKFALRCLFVVYILYFLLNVSGLSAMAFSVKWLSWHYVTEHPWSKYCALLDIVTNYLAAFVNTIAYLIMFIFLFCKRTSNVLKNYEVRITLQVFSFCCYEVICLFVWEVVEVYFIPYNHQVALVNLFMWVLWNGCSALPYLCFNSTVRELVAKRWRLLCSRCFFSISELSPKTTEVPFMTNKRVSIPQ